MTPHAVQPEPCIRNSEWRIVRVNALSVPDFSPVPTILRTLAVFYHDGPTVDSLRRLELIPRGRRRVLFLHDHRAIRKRLSWVLSQEPGDHCRRVIDLDCRVYAVADAVDKRSGVAQLFVFTPVQSSIFSAAQKRFELRLKLRKFGWEKSTRQRQTAFLSVAAR